MSPDPDAVRCDCGVLLVEGLGRRTIIVSGELVVFRRTTDFVLCTGCHALRSIAELRATAQLV